MPNKFDDEDELDKKIEAQNKKIMGYVFNIFVSMMTAIITVLLFGNYLKWPVSQMVIKDVIAETIIGSITLLHKSSLVSIRFSSL